MKNYKLFFVAFTVCNVICFLITEEDMNFIFAGFCLVMAWIEKTKFDIIKHFNKEK